jgi:hypothetical protein
LCQQPSTGNWPLATAQGRLFAQQATKSARSDRCQGSCPQWAQAQNQYQRKNQNHWNKNSPKAKLYPVIKYDSVNDAHGTIMFIGLSNLYSIGFE